MDSPETPENEFLKKLTEIIEANLSNPQFGVSLFARELGMSRFTLHRKVNQLTKITVSQFINQVRLKKAKDILRHTNSTISDVAFQTGYNSTSYFIKCFHKYYGYPPGEVGSRENDENNSTTAQFNKKKIIVLSSVILILFFFLILLFVFKPFSLKNSELDKTISILPFTDDSPEKDKLYIITGIRNEIFNKLEKVSEIKIRYSTLSDKSTPLLSIKEIAEDLDVNYILKGNGQVIENKIKITLYLIDTKSGDNLWTQPYIKEVVEEDLFNLYEEVAFDVAKEINATISPEEKEQIHKRYTDNKEAYTLYLEGRFYYGLSGQENTRNSIKLYNQALELDSNYSLAYSGLADSYLGLAWVQFESKKETAAIGKKFALKALEKDKDLAEVHATLGSIYSFFEFNWKAAEVEFKKAIEINPSYASTHYRYADYLDAFGRKVDAREHINRAIELDPYKRGFRYISYWYYFKEGNYNKALNEADKIFGLDKDERIHHLLKFQVYIWQGEGLKAVNEFKKLLYIEQPEINIEILDSIYANTGIEGIIRYRIDVEMKKDTLSNGVRVARLYALLGEKQSALDHLERAYNNDVSWISTIKYDISFKDFRTEPRFNALLEQVNLGGY